MTVTAPAGPALAPGLHARIPMSQYLALDAIGSTHLDWLATSPLHYSYMRRQPYLSTAALDLGTALHTAVLEPEYFNETYALEPDVEKIGGAKPRATKEYRKGVEDMEQGGFIVLRRDVWDKVDAMREAIYAHRPATQLLDKAPRREITMLWNRRGKLCRGRADLLGDIVLGDLKTTRSLRDFSPWAISRYGYYRQMAWYEHGLMGHDAVVEHFYHLVVESSPPYDVGVFALDDPSLLAGRRSCEDLMQRLAECEETGKWPGMFPTVQIGSITDRELEGLSDDGGDE